MKKTLGIILVLACCSFLSACSLFDNEAPVLTCNQDEKISIEANSDFNFDSYLTITDNATDSSEIILSSTLDSSILGEQEITISATDLKENTSTLDLTVNVVDTTAPEITLNGEENVILNYDYDYDEKGATVKDNYDEECEVTVEGDVDTSKIGSYHIVYTCKDSSGNQSSVERIVEIKDLTPPVIKTAEDDSIVITLGEYIPDDYFTATDYIDGDVNTEVIGEINYLKSGDYPITITASDSSGNIATEEKTLTILPLITESDTGLQLAIKEFIITDTGVYYDENTVLSLDVEYINPTDRSGEFYPTYSFITESKNITNKIQCYFGLVTNLNPDDVVEDTIDIIYYGDRSEFNTLTEIAFEITFNNINIKPTKTYSLCFQELVDRSTIN